MPVTQIPSRDPLPRDQTPRDPEHPEQRDLFEAQHWEAAYRSFNPDDVPHLLIQLQDDLSRARKREALWLSVILHLLVIILLWNTEKLMGLLPHRTLDLAMRADNGSKDATFLELPPDEQKLARRPNAKALSDKDRIATSKAPQPNREELKKLLQSPHPGPPGQRMQAPPAQAQPQQNQPPQAQQPPAPQESTPQQGFSPPAQSDQPAQLRTPPQPSRPVPNFNTPLTACDPIAQAEEAAAASRGRYGAGSAGDFGLTRGRGAFKAADGAEILTDTMGVDFGPYLQRVVAIVRQNWYNLMPPSVYPPILKQGKLALEFVILKDGKETSLALRTSSGDVALDRAAWGSITASTPFPPLPKEFPGQLLGLRFYYFYNLEPGGDLK